MNVNEMHRALEEAIDSGFGELECFGKDGQGMSYEVSTTGLVCTPMYIEGGPLLEEDDTMEYLSFNLEY